MKKHERQSNASQLLRSKNFFDQNSPVSEVLPEIFG